MSSSQESGETEIRVGQTMSEEEDRWSYLKGFTFRSAS